MKFFAKVILQLHLISRLISGNYFDYSVLDLNIEQFVQRHGYPCEVHEVQTEDDYLLGLYRIPYGKNEKVHWSESKTPVFIMHGLAGTAMNFLCLGPQKSLAYRLADEGYDVWLGNKRGSTFSRKHVFHDPDQKSNNFWDFSFHEEGMYDLPACIDYILNRTSHKQIVYIGMSEGSTSFMVMASSRPSYNEKIKLMIALAPSAYYRNNRQFAARLKPLGSFFEFLSNVLMIKELLRPTITFKMLSRNLCMDGSPYQIICYNIYKVLSSSDDSQINSTLLAVFANDVSGISVKSPLHYLQLIQTDLFRPYDHGPIENYRRYGTTIPPSYNLSAITSPLYIFYSMNDDSQSVSDVNILIKKLPNVVKSKLVEYDKFSHMDFVFANDINKFVHNELIDFLNKFIKLGNTDK